MKCESHTNVKAECCPICLLEEMLKFKTALCDIALVNIGKEPAEACCKMQEIAAEALKGRK